MIEKSKTLKKILELNQELFSTLLVTYLILLLIETIWKGSVSSYMNINYLLFIVIISGIIMVLTSDKETKVEYEPITKKDYIFIIAIGIIGSIIIWYKTQDIGWISYLISILSGVLIILLSILVLEEDKT